MKCYVIDLCVVSMSSDYYSVGYWLNRNQLLSERSIWLSRSIEVTDKDASEIHKGTPKKRMLLNLNKVDPNYIKLTWLGK